MIRLLFVLLYAFWQGGFLFYTAVVVPIGTQVLGSTTEQGFITRLVTRQINHWGVVCLAVWLPILWWETRDRHRLRGGLLSAWLFMAILQGALYILHGRLDSLLDVNEHMVLDHEHFYSWHRIYLWLITVQWGLALGTLAAVVIHWNRLPSSPRHRPCTPPVEALISHQPAPAQIGEN